MPLTIESQTPTLSPDTEGVVRVGGTRVRLDTIVEAFREGLAAEEIAAQYPSVSLADVYAAIANYLRSTPAVDDCLEERRRVAGEVRCENEQRFPPDGLRRRLLARTR